jgi:hypothetical protein
MNNFIIGQITPDLLAHLKWGTYILFGALSFLGAAFIYFFFPEVSYLVFEVMCSTNEIVRRPRVSPWRRWTSCLGQSVLLRLTPSVCVRLPVRSAWIRWSRETVSLHRECTSRRCWTRRWARRLASMGPSPTRRGV